MVQFIAISKTLPISKVQEMLDQSAREVKRKVMTFTSQVLSARGHILTAKTSRFGGAWGRASICYSSGRTTTLPMRGRRKSIAPNTHLSD